jgi:N-acetylglucosaminyl-diphospho-decaprenol L-rhamnosyltransferase
MPDAAAQDCAMLVSIVNYRTGAHVEKCLASLEPEIAVAPDVRVIVVDNASGDGSADRIERAIADHGWGWARLVRSPVNGGFAAGNNVALRHGLVGANRAPLVWLLNPDTCVHPGAVRAILRFMKAHPRAGIAGTMIHEQDGTAWPFSFHFPSLLGEFEQGAGIGIVSRLLARRAGLKRMGAEPAQAEWVSGASMVVRQALIEAIGPMDEGFFLYFEETDYCLRASRAGWQCWYVPDAAVTHVAGASTGATGASSVGRRVKAYWFESRRRYFIKNHGRAYAVAADLVWALAHLLRRLRKATVRRPTALPPALLRDFIHHSALWNGLPDARCR